MQAKAGHTVSHDFEPIIIEEVFYNVKASTKNEMLYDPRIAKNMLTPQVLFDRVRMMQTGASMSSNANSFISMGQSTQMAGYPKLTPQSKI